jgi:hypothetical protein
MGFPPLMLRLDYRTLRLALRIVQRLTAGGDSVEGLSLLRELLAGLVNSNQLLEDIEGWTASALRVLPPSNIAAYSRSLPNIVKTFAASGHANEAVRVMATGAGLDPALSGQLAQAARQAFVRTAPGEVSEDPVAAARELTDIGRRVLEAGNPEGIVLMGAAHNVAPQYGFPVDDIEANIGRLQERQRAAFDAGEAQALTKAAYDLWYSGRRESAVRLGAVVPSMLPGPSAERWFGHLEGAVRPGTEEAFHTSRQIFDKGYVAQAANLLIDSGSVSAEDMWASLDREIVSPSQELRTPGRVNFLARSIRSLAESAEVGPPDPSFFFALEGEGARCDEALWGATFDLVFRYDVPTADALAGVIGKRLDPLLQKTNAELGIIVLPSGLTLTDGVAGRVVRFEDGKMVGDPPRFRLKAPDKPADAEPQSSTVHIQFMISRAVIYSFDLEINIVDQFVAEPCVARILDLDLQEVAATKVDERRDARLYIYRDREAWRVAWSVGDDALTEPTLTPSLTISNLSQEYETSKILDDLREIAHNSVWKNIDENFELGPEKELQDSARACLNTAIAAGAKLYMRLSEDPILSKALRVIDGLPNGSKISIYTDRTVFPWELLYPYDAEESFPPTNFEPKSLWGHRFLIESLLFSKTGTEKLPVSRQQPGKLHVSMGLDRAIDHDWQDRPLRPVQLQKDYFDRFLKDRGSYFDEYDEIRFILSEPDPATLIYFFCHGAADRLQFDKSKPMMTADYANGKNCAGWPIVFINACEAGSISPLSFFSFRTKFRERKAAGLIAPSFPIPTLFAAVFAKALIARYTDHQPIGRALFDLRRDLLAKDNPLGLWYSLQCPLDVKAPEL